MKKEPWSDQKERKMRRRERREKKQLKKGNASKAKRNEVKSDGGEEAEDWTIEARLLKRLKTGKITEAQFEKALESKLPSSLLLSE